MYEIAKYVIGALIVFGITRFFQSHWLYIIVPKLWLNTPLSDGLIATIELYNAGFSSEEDVTITIRKGCKFELIAKSKSTLVVQDNILTVPKLSKFERVTIHLLIEDKSFQEAFVESVESKGTKGRVVDRKENATGPWGAFFGLPLVLLFLIVPFSFGTVVGSEMKTSAWDYVDKKLFPPVTKELGRFETNLEERYSLGKLEGALKAKRITVELAQAVREGDIITLTYKISSAYGSPLFVGGRVESSGGKEVSSLLTDTYMSNAALVSGEDKTVQFKVYLPENTKIKIVKASFDFETVEGARSNAIHMTTFP